MGSAGGSLYGTDPSLLARLRLDYSDGTTQWVDTNDSTWSARVGPVRAADLIDGESYDARLDQRGWLLATLRRQRLEPRHVASLHG